MEMMTTKKASFQQTPLTPQYVYTMIELTTFQYYGLIYLLTGTIVGFCLESMVRWGKEDVNMRERISLIIFWPIMALIFIINFFKGFFQ